MATRTPSRRAKADGALKHLGQAEQIKLLSLLLKTHPELQVEAEALALNLITAVDLEAVAEEVVWAFQGFDQEEIWDRSGGDRHGGYTEPAEAAGEICEERFEPLMARLERLLAMGQMEAALAQVKGLLLGLYRLEAELPPDAEDFPSETGAFRVLEAWVKNAPKEMDPALAEWLRFEGPVDWSSHLETLWRGLQVRFRKPR
jgi:hypothetical protein